MELTKEQQQAYKWAINQSFPSVAATYAKILAGVITQLEAENERLDKAFSWSAEKYAQLEDALDTIANDHQTQASFAAREDWHGLFNWAQDIAKTALGGERD